MSNGFPDLIEINAVSKSYILKNISLSIKEGESIFILGPNGAGKTTLMKAVLGLVRADSGSIKILGNQPASLEARSAIGFLSELPLKLDDLSKSEFLALFRQLNIQSLKNQDQSLDQLINELIANIAPEKLINTYSKGMLQRLNFARVLLNNPKILFLDEPATGLDPIGQLNITNIIKKLKSLGRTIYVNTHNIDFAIELASRIIVLNQGEIVFDSLDKQFSKELLSDLFLSFDSKRS